ncbi:hypothetical protein CEXT_675031 [Caerostris extrusa]|uniref:Uncharacterized protein n=1 Tax=Caerostris extrusa TaxID=172846 RepID=A0AAV4S3G9_CAEEX|nr:hypothetical protein CEXT_675031 [Caerostris extrusa]
MLTFTVETEFYEVLKRLKFCEIKFLTSCKKPKIFSPKTGSSGSISKCFYRDLRLHKVPITTDNNKELSVVEFYRLGYAG